MLSRRVVVDEAPNLTVVKTAVVVELRAAIARRQGPARRCRRPATTGRPCGLSQRAGQATGRRTVLDASQETEDRRRDAQDSAARHCRLHSVRFRCRTAPSSEAYAPRLTVPTGRHPAVHGASSSLRRNPWTPAQRRCCPESPDPRQAPRNSPVPGKHLGCGFDGRPPGAAPPAPSFQTGTI